MIISIKHEMLVFWAAFLCGQILGIFFDFIRSMRKNLPHNKAIVAIEDVVFCTLAFKLFFDTCYVTNNGNLRLYIFASLICSGVIYFCIISNFILGIWNFLFKFLCKIFRPFLRFFAFVKLKITGVIAKCKPCVKHTLAKAGKIKKYLKPKRHRGPCKNKKTT